MKTAKKLSLSVFAIFFVLFNIIVLPFAFLFEVTEVYWIAYGFSVIAFALTAYIMYSTINSTQALKSKFLELPLVVIAYWYFVIQLIWAIILFALSIIQPEGLIIQLPMISLIGSSVILGLAVLALLITKTGIIEVNRVEDTVKLNVDFIKNTLLEVELLINRTKDESTKKALQELVASIKYSDPMSHSSLSEIETRVTDTIKEASLMSDEISDVKKLVVEVIDLLKERNLKCKLLK